MEQNLIQLCYESRAAAGLDPAQVFQIIAVSNRKNLDNELTGFLLFSDGRFFQVVEGDKSSVEHLMERLERDPRHTDIRVVRSATISKRSFPQWSMKRIMLGKAASTPAPVPAEIAQAPAPVVRAVEDFLHQGRVISH